MPISGRQMLQAMPMSGRQMLQAMPISGKQMLEAQKRAHNFSLAVWDILNQLKSLFYIVSLTKILLSCEELVSYLEYQSVSPFLRIGSPPLSRKRVCPPPLLGTKEGSQSNSDNWRESLE
jgi:hypothetical protein